MSVRQAPLVSIVLTAHNEQDTIGATLTLLAGQTGLPPEQIEVILVDDRSTDATTRRAQAVGLTELRILHHAPDPTVRLTTRQGALDLGFRNARGQVTLTLDADSRVSADWAARMSAPILAGDADAVAGPVGFDPAEGPMGGWQSCDAAQYLTVCAWLHDLGMAVGALFGNFAFRADLYDKVGGFQAIGYTLTEDRGFARAIQRSGARLAFASALQRVDVRACTSVAALLERVLRVSSGPFSVLVFILTLWPLTLLISAVAALVIGGTATWLVFILRYLAGVALVLHGLRRFGPWRAARHAPWYEVGAYAAGVGAFFRTMRQRRVRWGGQLYDR